MVTRSVAATFAALSVSIAQGQFPSGELKEVPIDELKKAYLACGRAAMSGQLNTAEIMQCSVVYEELKLRAFGGDFEKMRAWSRAQSDQAPDGRLY